MPPICAHISTYRQACISHIAYIPSPKGANTFVHTCRVTCLCLSIFVSQRPCVFVSLSPCLLASGFLCLCDTLCVPLCFCVFVLCLYVPVILSVYACVCTLTHTGTHTHITLAQAHEQAQMQTHTHTDTETERERYREYISIVSKHVLSYICIMRSNVYTFVLRTANRWVWLLGKNLHFVLNFCRWLILKESWGVAVCGINSKVDSF